jgi:hypothetical protein
MIETRAASIAIAFVAVIEPGLASFVAVVKMMVIGADPYAAGTNVDLFRKCGCRKNKQRGGDCN